MTLSYYYHNDAIIKIPRKGLRLVVTVMSNRKLAVRFLTARE